MLLTQLVPLAALFAVLNALELSEIKKTEAEDVVENNKLEDSPVCDLTENLCDINCCNDKDCTDIEKNSFHCTDKEFQEKGLFDKFSCDSPSFKDFDGRALLCLQHENSPYLGEFYVEDEPYTSDDIPSVLHARKKHIKSFTKNLLNLTNMLIDYDYGSSVIEYIHEIKRAKIQLPSNVLMSSGFCVQQPIRFMVDFQSNCLYTLSEETCVTAKTFNISNYIPSNQVLIYGGNDRNISIKPVVICLRNATEYVTFYRNTFDLVDLPIVSKKTNSECCYNNYSKLNKLKGICENVVIDLRYEFYINRTSIVDAKLLILIGDVPVNIRSYLIQSNGKYRLKKMENNSENVMYLSQTFTVKYNAVNASGMPIKKYGYKFGQMLQSVYTQGSYF